MALIRWHGTIYSGEPVRLLEDGKTWRFKMKQHGPRWAAGGEIDVKQSEIVEMRFFAGLTVEEIGEVLDISPATVKREWATAKLWLRRQMQGL